MSGVELVNGLSRLMTRLPSPLGLAVVIDLVLLARMPRRTWHRRVLGASLALLFVAGNHYSSVSLARSLERRYMPIQLLSDQRNAPWTRDDARGPGRAIVHFVFCRVDRIYMGRATSISPCVLSCYEGASTSPG